CPLIIRKTSELVLNLEKRFCVLHGRFDLQTVTDDCRVLHELLDACGSEARHALGIETFKGFAVPFTPLENGDPAQARLCALENEKLKKFPVVMDRYTPLLVMIFDVDGIRAGPAAALGFG